MTDYDWNKSTGDDTPALRNSTERNPSINILQIDNAKLAEKNHAHHGGKSNKNPITSQDEGTAPHISPIGSINIAPGSAQYKPRLHRKICYNCREYNHLGSNCAWPSEKTVYIPHDEDANVVCHLPDDYISLGNLKDRWEWIQQATLGIPSTFKTPAPPDTSAAMQQATKEYSSAKFLLL